MSTKRIATYLGRTKLCFKHFSCGTSQYDLSQRQLWQMERTFNKICSNLSTEWLDARLNHPFEKYARQTGSFPQGRGENWKIQYVKPPSKFEFTSNFWVLFLFATPLSRQSGSKVISLCWFHPEKSPKILNPASKLSGSSSKPPFFQGRTVC